MGYLVKDRVETVVAPAIPAQAAVPAFDLRLYAPPSPLGYGYTPLASAGAFGGWVPLQLQPLTASVVGVPGPLTFVPIADLFPPGGGSSALPAGSTPVYEDIDGESVLTGYLVPSLVYVTVYSSPQWYGPAANMAYFTFDGATEVNGYPIVPVGATVTGTVTVPTVAGDVVLTRTFVKGADGRLLPSGGDADPALCTSKPGWGVVLLADFPGRDFVAGVPAVISVDLQPGWNAGANSLDPPIDGDVRAVFGINAIAGAIAVGFATHRPDVTSLASLTHAFYFDSTLDGYRAFVMERGAIMAGPFDFAPGVDECKLERVGAAGVVTLYINGDAVYTSARPVYGPLLVGSALYLAGDIIDATLNFTQIGGGEVTTPGPDGVLNGVLDLRMLLLGPTLEELGGVLNGVLSFEFRTEGEAPPDVDWSVLGGTLSLVSGYMYGPGTSDGVLAGVLELTGGFPSHTFGYEATDVLDVDLNLYGLLLGEGVLSPSDTPVDMVGLSDALAVDAGQATLMRMLLAARLDVAARTQRNRFEGLRTLTDDLALEAKLHLVFREVLSISLEIDADDTISYTAMAVLIARLRMTGVCTTSTQAHALLTEALVFGVMGGGYPWNVLSDSLSLSDAMTFTFAAVAHLLDTLAVSVAGSDVATMMAVLEDTLDVDVTGGAYFDGTAILRDQLSFVLNVSIDNEQYIAWTMNTNSKAATKYTNYNFNSFMRLGNKWYGANDTGLIELAGDDDDGDAILAKIRLGLQAQADGMVHSLPSLYAGLSATGDMLLRAVTVDPTDGARVAHTYRLNRNAQAGLRTARAKVGKGLQAVYFDYELENVDGADFQLDTVAWMPLNTDRRIKGNAGGEDT